MVASGDWIVPHLDGVRYFEKPILGYWLVAASISLIGENNFATRFPSALATGVTAAIIYLLIVGHYQCRRVGLLSAAAYLTCLSVFGIGTANILDSVFAMFMTAALAIFFFAYQRDQSRRRNRDMILGGIFTGLAFLTKGFIAFAIPVLVIVPFMLWEGKGKALVRTFWLPVLSACLVILPWTVMIHLRESDFWNYFFWTEHIRRFIGHDPQHPEPVWFYLLHIIWGALPWIVFFPAALIGLSKKSLREPFIRFVICWFIFPFLFFSISRGKLITYILPCYPPLIILIIFGTVEYFARGRQKMVNGGIRTLVGILILLFTGLITFQISGFPIGKFFHRLENWKWITAAGGLLIWTGFLLLSARRKKPLIKLFLFCISPVFFLFITHYIFPEAAQAGKAPEEFLRKNLKAINSKTILVSDSYCAPALCWISGRNDVLLLESEGELEYGLNYNDTSGKLLSFKEFINMIRSVDENERVILFLDKDRSRKYYRNMPRPTCVKTGSGFVLALFDKKNKEKDKQLF